MGPLLVLVSPCFRENVNVACKIVSFFCVVKIIFFWKMQLFSFGGKSNFKMARIWKRAIFDLLFTFFSHQGKGTKIFSAHIPFTYIHVFCSSYWLFLPSQFFKNCEFIMYGFWGGFSLVLILFRAIKEQSINNKCLANFRLECLLLIFVYTNGKFVVIYKPRTLNEDSDQYRKRKKHYFLVAAILFFIG